MTFRIFNTLMIPALSFSILLTSTAAIAQQTQPAKPVAITTTTPSEDRALALLASAHTVAIVDLGVDENFPPADVNGGSYLAADLMKWGRYRVLPNGTPADVTLQLQGMTRTGYVQATDDSAGYTTYNPYYKLTIIDPTDGSALWDLTIPVVSGRSGHQDLFQMSVQNVVSTLKNFEGVPLSKQELKNVRYLDTQRAKGRALGIGLIVGVVALAAGGALLAKHKFDEDVDKGNEEQHDFCVQNHIPNC